MEVRKAGERDIADLIELIQRTGETREKAEKRATRVKSNWRVINVLEEESRLLGYVGIKKFQIDINAGKSVDILNYSHLTWIGVDPDNRKRGYGTRLLASCDNVAREWGKIGIWLECQQKVLPFYCNTQYRIRGQYNDSSEERFVLFKRFKI